MLLHFSCPAPAAHTEVFNRSSESGLLVSLEMIKRYHDVSVHNRAPYVCFLTVFPVRNRYRYIIRSPESIRYDYLTSRSHGIESVYIGTVQMFKRMLAAARIQCIAVCQKRQAPGFLYNICDCLCIIRSQICEISQFSEMHFDRHEFPFHVDRADPCQFDQFLELRSKTNSQNGSEIRKVYL